MFRDAIKKCDAVLKPLGLSIFDILTNKSKRTFDNILHCFVGIAAMQVSNRSIARTKNSFIKEDL